MRRKCREAVSSRAGPGWGGRWGCHSQAHHLQGEALFAEGEFEHAAVAFHRAARLRPEMSSFRLGIQKCTAAVIRVRPPPARRR